MVYPCGVVHCTEPYLISYGLFTAFSFYVSYFQFSLWHNNFKKLEIHGVNSERKACMRATIFTKCNNNRHVYKTTV